MFPSLSRLTNSSRACRGVWEMESSGKPTCAMVWTSRFSAWRTPEKVWLRSAGTSVRSAPSGCGARPRATRVSWTSSRACLTVGLGRPRGRTALVVLLAGDRAPVEKLLGPGEVGPGAVAGRLPAPQGRDPGLELRDRVVDLLDRRLELPALAPGLGQDAPDLGPRGLHVGLRVDHGRLLEVDLDLVRLPVELDQQVPLAHPLVVVHQDPAHLAGDPGGHVGHVAVDVGVVGGDRLHHRLDGRRQGVTSERQAGHGPRPQQPPPPGVRRPPRRLGRRDRRRIGRPVRGSVVRRSRGTGRRRT